jgi:UDP-N-acetyl-2-amino-2-deoxyglucuronate dehydrogenase
MNPFPLRLGLIGSGSFGQFCLQQYRDMADIVPVAVTDTLPEPAKFSAERFGLKVIASPEQMLKSPEVDLIHIATPSSSHYELAAAALK